MGWFGYGRYDGDDTQTQHYTFFEWAKMPASQDEISEWLGRTKTKIPLHLIPTFKKNFSRILGQMPKTKFWDEDKAIQWQMLMCLLLDNNIKLPNLVKKNGILATEYLLGSHCDDFREPSKRRATLRRLLKRVS